MPMALCPFTGMYSRSGANHTCCCLGGYVCRHALAGVECRHDHASRPGWAAAWVCLCNECALRRRSRLLTACQCAGACVGAGARSGVGVSTGGQAAARANFIKKKEKQLKTIKKKLKRSFNFFGPSRADTATHTIPLLCAPISSTPLKTHHHAANMNSHVGNAPADPAQHAEARYGRIPVTACQGLDRLPVHARWLAFSSSWVHCNPLAPSLACLQW